MASANDSDFAEGNWQFACTDWDTNLAQLYKTADDPTRTCDVSLGGLTVSTERLTNGAQFSFPTYEGSLQILIYVPDVTLDRWAFLAPFKTELWLALFGTAAAVAVVVWLQELPLSKIFQHPVPALQKLSNLQWASMALLMQLFAEFSARRTGARLTILGYGFLVLIVINTYMAVLASRLTVNSIRLNINSINDLAAKPVGVFEDEVGAVKAATSLAVVVPLRWDTLEDEQEILRKLRSGEVAALLFDSPWVQYQAATSCDLYVVGEKQKILPSNYAFGFPMDFNYTRLKKVNTILIELMEEGIYTSLESQYIQPTTSCPSKLADADLSSIQLGFEQMSGLWIFLAAATGLGWMVDFSQALWKCWRRRRAQAAVSAQGDSEAPADLSIQTGDFGRANSNTDDVEKAYGKAQSMTGGGNMAGRPDLAPSVSGLSFSGLSMRLGTRSFFGRPEVAGSWMAVAEASTVEEMVQVLELQVRHMDLRMRKMLPALERRVERNHQQLLAAMEALAAGKFANGCSANGVVGAGMGLASYNDLITSGEQMLQAVVSDGKAAGDAQAAGRLGGAGGGLGEGILKCGMPGAGGAADEDVSVWGGGGGVDAVIALQPPAPPVRMQTAPVSTRSLLLSLDASTRSGRYPACSGGDTHGTAHMASSPGAAGADSRSVRLGSRVQFLPTTCGPAPGGGFGGAAGEEDVAALPGSPVRRSRSGTTSDAVAMVTDAAGVSAVHVAGMQSAPSFGRLLHQPLDRPPSNVPLGKRQEGSGGQA